jgi:hypothetical protein
MQTYEHTQRAYWMFAVPLLIIVPLGLGLLTDPGAPLAALWFPVAILVLAVTGFFAMTTSVDSNGVRWSFAFGWPAGSVRLEDIESAQATRTNLFEGWGLHYTIWHGWLWNVSGFQAVEIRHSGGKRVTLGTDDPQGLLQAIERFRTGAA